MEQDHDMIVGLMARVDYLEQEVASLRAERSRVIWGVMVTLFGIIGSGVVYIWTAHR